MRHVSDPAALPAAVTGATAVLVRTSKLDDRRDAVCATLSMGGAPEAVVAITYRGPAVSWLERVAGHRGDPETVRVITVGDGHAADTEPGGDRVTVDRVQSPSNLTALEVAISKGLDGVGDDERATVCFDSLTAFLQYVELSEAYRYLHALIERLWEAGVVGHFHVDPAAHDEGTLNTLTGLFDAVVDTEVDDGVGVRTSAGVGAEGGEGADGR